MTEVEPRILAAWREWLAALASDPDAAIAASHVYGALSCEGRDAWLDALEEDAPKLGVPKVALYAPLLSVEADPARIDRIRGSVAAALADDSGTPSGMMAVSPRHTTAFRGVTRDSRRARVAALVAPLYGDFVQILWCRYSPNTGFDWVRLDAIHRVSDAPRAGQQAEGVVLESTPLKLVVEELALAILAQRRRGIEIPPSMINFANLFDAKLDADSNS